MKQGIIKSLDKNGFGYISFEDEDKNIFFHCSNVIGEARFDELKIGDKVSIKETTESEHKGIIKKECKGVELVK
jgi:cold shock CspA family protein